MGGTDGMLKLFVISTLALIALCTLTLCDFIFGIGLLGGIFGAVVGALGGVLGLVAGAFGVLIGLIAGLAGIGMLLALTVLIIGGVVMLFSAA